MFPTIVDNDSKRENCKLTAGLAKSTFSTALPPLAAALAGSQRDREKGGPPHGCRPEVEIGSENRVATCQTDLQNQGKLLQSQIWTPRPK